MNIKKFLPQRLKNEFHKFQALLAHIQYNFPASSLKIIGVTGTDGKTTTSTMIYHILRTGGFRVGAITTISAKFNDKEIETGFHVTTPDPNDIPKLLRMMVNHGIEWVVMEVTSHGLDQNRVAFVNFEKAVFTNITKEHLDYHKSWKKLALAKTRLIDQVNEGSEIIYKEDEMGAKMVERKIKRSKKVLLSTKCSDELVKKKEITKEGLSFLYKIKGKEVEIKIPILGEYNIANAQCAIKTCERLVDRKTIIEALSSFETVKGRMNIIKKKRPCMIIIDFAHTPNSLKNALKTVRNLKGKGRIISVFGTAGERDKKKRKSMGRIAIKLAEIIVLTAEDPRTEELRKINSEIIKGIKSRTKKYHIKRFKSRRIFQRQDFKKLRKRVDEDVKDKMNVVLVFDQEKPKSREDAIECAIRIARSDDIVIITGKGHERSLCFGTKEYSWSDFEAVKRALRIRYDKLNG